MTEQSDPAENSDADQDNAREKPQSIDPWAGIYREVKAEQLELENHYREVAGKQSYSEDLRAAFDAYSDQSEEFTPGSLIQWKPFMRSAQYPHYGNPVIVVSKIGRPSTVENGDPVLEPKDLVVGYLDGDQDFVVFAASSRRFTSWSSSTSHS